MLKLEHVNKYFNKNKKNEIHVINETSLHMEGKGLVALLGPRHVETHSPQCHRRAGQGKQRTDLCQWPEDNGKAFPYSGQDKEPQCRVCVPEL